MNLRKTKKDILNGNIPEQIVIFTVSLMGSYMIQQLYQIVDSIVLGRFAGNTALAAIGSATSVINVVLNFISGIASGTMIVVAQSYGSHNPDKVKSSVKTGIFISVFLGALLTLLTVFVSNPILKLTGCPEDSIAQSGIYLRMYAYSFIPYLIFTIGKNILIATGDSKRSLMFTIIIAIVKISLDLMLTGALKMGIWGVSIATMVAYVVCAFVTLAIFNNTTDIYQFSIKEFGCDFVSLKNIFKIGLPAAIQSMLFAATTLLIQTKINAYGTDTIAAFSAYNNVDNFYWCFANSYASAIITLVGQNYGNKNMKRVLNIANNGIIIFSISSVVLGLTLGLSGRYLLQLFTDDLKVIEIGYSMLWSVCLYYPAYTFLETLAGVCKGCGDATNSMIICIVGVCIVRVLYLTLFQFKDVTQVILCYVISWTITSIIYIVYFLFSKKYKLTKAD